MKKLVLASLVITAMVTLTLGAVKNQSSLPENPLLTANVEALSQGESFGGDVYDVGGGTILIKNAKNATSGKRMLNYCIDAPNCVCTISVNCTANGFPNITYLVDKILNKLNFSDLFKFIKNLKG